MAPFAMALECSACGGAGTDLAPGMTGPRMVRCEPCEGTGRGPCTGCGEPHDGIATPDGKDVLCNTCRAEWIAAGVLVEGGPASSDAPADSRAA